MKERTEPDEIGASCALSTWSGMKTGREPGGRLRRSSASLNATILPQTSSDRNSSSCSVRPVVLKYRRMLLLVGKLVESLLPTILLSATNEMAGQDCARIMAGHKGSPSVCAGQVGAEPAAAVGGGAARLEELCEHVRQPTRRVLSTDTCSI